MEKVGSWDKNRVISELIHGRDLANELKKQIHPINISKEDCHFLMEKIISSYDNALALINCMALLGNGDTSHQLEVSTILQSPISTEGSPRSEGSDPDSKIQTRKYVTKKRKTLPRRSEQVQVCSGTGFDGQIDDGYNWRKYGQKDILGANHPRAYYRCTYRNTQGCLANKQVQRTDEDPSILEVIYIGKHSCIQERLKQNKENIDTQRKIRKIERDLEQIIISDESGLKVETQELDSQEGNFSSFSFPSTPIQYENAEAQFFSDPTNIDVTSYSPSFLTSKTSESYFSLSPCQAKEFGIGQSSELDFAEIISNPTPIINFPSGDLDFLIDEVEFDTHFFNNQSKFW